jgi:hypothetical protein
MTSTSNSLVKDEADSFYKHQPPQPQWDGAFHTYGQAIKAIKQNANPALFYIAVLAAISIATNLLLNRSLVVKPAHFVLQSLVEVLVMLIFLPFNVRYALALAKGKQLTVGQLLQPSLKLYINLIITLIMVAVLYVAGSLTLGILLIWFLPWCLLMLLPVADLGYGPSAAFREARRLSAKNKGKAWAIFGVSILPSVAIALLDHVPVVGSVLSPVVTLVYYTAAAFLYVWLRENVAD